MRIYDIEDMIIAINAIDGVRRDNNCNNFQINEIESGGERFPECCAGLAGKGHLSYSDGVITVNPSYHKYTVKLKAAHKLCIEV